MNEERKTIYELGIEFSVVLLLFLYPYGADQMGLPHNFWLGLGCWIIGSLIAARMFWIFPLWAQKFTRLEKWLILIICVALFAGFFYRPVAAAYSRRNQTGEPTASQPNPQPSNPAPVQKETPKQQPYSAIPQKKRPSVVVQKQNKGTGNTQQNSSGNNSPNNQTNNGIINNASNLGNQNVTVDLDRVLTADNADKLKSALRDKRGVVYLSAVGGGAEQQNLAMQLQPIISDVDGWEAHLGAADEITGYPVHGLEVQPDRGQEAAAIALVKAFNAAGLKSSLSPHPLTPGLDAPAGAINVQIGSK